VSPKVKMGILGTGSYLPEKVLTNQDMEKMVNTSNDWIVTRTGIHERRIAAENQATSDLAAAAGRAALEKAKLKPSDLDLILVATISPDMPTPSTACLVQSKLGALQAAAFDISAACSGFVYGLAVAKAFIESGVYRHILLVGAEKLSTFIDWKDRTTCVLFGDGAGAVVLGPLDGNHGEVLTTFLAANGGEADLLKIPGGGSQNPVSADSIEKGLHYLKMQGKEIFKIGVKVMADAALKVIQSAGLSVDQVALFILHQANLRIMQAVAERLGIPPEKLYVNVDKIGNTSAASIVLALDEAVKKGRIHAGDYVVLSAVGAGTTYAAALIHW